MRCVWVSITNVKEQFDELFSIQVIGSANLHYIASLFYVTLQPFLWFVCLFVECSLTIILFKFEYVSYAHQSVATIFIDNWSLYILR